MIRSDYDEISNSNVVNQLKVELQNFKFYIYTKHGRVITDGNFIKKFATQIKELWVDSTDIMMENLSDITLNDMQMLTNTLSSSNIKVCVVACFSLFKTF